MIIVLAGAKQHGKDTFAKVLKETFPEFTFQRAAFADKMKELAAQLLGCTLEELEYLKTEEDTVVTNPYCIAEGKSMREFLQTFGQLMKDVTNNRNFWCEIMGEDLKPIRQSGSVNNSDNINLLSLDTVNDPVGIFYKFPNIIGIVF